MNEAHFAPAPVLDLWGWAKQEAGRAAATAVRRRELAAAKDAKQAVLEQTPQWLDAKEKRSAAREARKQAIKESESAVAAMAAATEAKKSLRLLSLHKEVRDLVAQEKAADAAEIQSIRMLADAVHKGEVPTVVETADGVQHELVLPTRPKSTAKMKALPKEDAPSGDARKEEDPEGDLHVSPEVLEDINLFKNGTKTPKERRDAAGRLLGALVGGAACPKGMDRKALITSAKKAMKEPDAQVSTLRAPEGALALTVGFECAPTVNLVPMMEEVTGVELGDLFIAPTGEILEVAGIKPRRKTLSLKRGCKGSTASTLTSGATIRRLSSPAGASPAAPAAPAPVAADDSL